MRCGASCSSPRWGLPSEASPPLHTTMPPHHPPVCPSRAQRSALSDAELAEIRAIERVGHRRRRQWLNDKLLRDLAGAMSTQDMVRLIPAGKHSGILLHAHTPSSTDQSDLQPLSATLTHLTTQLNDTTQSTGDAAATAPPPVCRTQERQFKPVPFGFPAPPSAFTLASAPEHAAVWEHFRSIDSDKEARVLQVCRPVGSHMQTATMHNTRQVCMKSKPIGAQGTPGRGVLPCHTQHMRLAGCALCGAQPRCVEQPRQCEQPGQCVGASICTLHTLTAPCHGLHLTHLPTRYPSMCLSVGLGGS